MHAWQAEHSADEWQRFCWPCDKYFSSEPELTQHQTECTSPMKYMTRIEGDYFNALLLEQARPERSLATGNGEAHGDADSNDISAGAAEDPFASPPSQSLHLHDEDLGSETVDMQPSNSEIIHSVPDAGLRQSEAPQRIQRVDTLPRRSSCGAPPSRTLPVFPPVPSNPPQSIRLDANVIPQNHRRHSTAGNEAMTPRALPHSPLRSPSVSMWDASASCPQQSERIMGDTGSPAEEEAPPPYTFTVIQDVLPLRPLPNSPGSAVSVEEQPRPPANDSRTCSLAIDSSRRARGDSSLGSVSTPTPSAYECPLCFECEDDLSNVPCGHVFCTPCISNHLEANVYCPLCRAPAERKDTRKVFLNT
ncbi:hypothetical protein DFH11DRAFT_285092 [Phellopilus nigrolimitatus]|nr:hypothetical protein DFH11DRAFT_285092 [Phellopilus nigrolimitatus]